MENRHQYTLPAVELLAEHTGPEAIISYYVSLRPGVAWQEAFQAAFGITVAECYHRFEEHRAAGFPEVDISTAEAREFRASQLETLFDENIKKTERREAFRK